MSGIDYTSPSSDELCGGHRFDVMPLGDSNVIADGNELPQVSVQNLDVGTDVRAPLSIGSHDMMDTTNVLVSMVFDCVVGYVGSSSTIAPVNHAYLCLNVTDGVVRLEIVPFTNSRLGSTYEGDGRRKNTHGLFQHIEVFAATPVSDTSSLGARYTPSYIDLGNYDQQCQHCGCLFWYNERIRNNNYGRRVEYHLCCGGGKIYIPLIPDPPIFIQLLLRNSHFMEHIRAYNQMFAMTSFGAKVDDSVNKGKGPYVFKVSGQIYHWIGGREEDTLNPKIVEGLIHVLDKHNGLVRLFRKARDRCNAGEIPRFKIRLYNKGGARGYELPTSDILGGIVFEDGPKSRTNFDVIIKFQGGHPQRINKLHQSYMSLHFPLLFVFREPGFYPKLLLKPKNGGRLFQQYIVAAFYAIKQGRLNFIRKRQSDLRFDYLLCLYDAISRGDHEGIQARTMIMLPRTFTGGPRYMYNQYLDTLALSKLKFMEHVRVASWFRSLCNAQSDFAAKEQIVWVDIEGVPLNAWSRSTFQKIGSKWGELVVLEDGYEDLFARKRICIMTSHTENILESFKLIVKGKVFWARAKELFVWSPSFKEVPEQELCSDDESIKANEEANNLNLGDENDSEVVSDTYFGDNGEDQGVEHHHGEPSKVKEVSADPFNIYGLLDKRNNEARTTDSSTSIPYPPGFTPANDIPTCNQDSPDVASVRPTSKSARRN
ncbi:DNA helicase, partial [Tanacetum coccineum]